MADVLSPTRALPFATTTAFKSFKLVWPPTTRTIEWKGLSPKALEFESYRRVSDEFLGDSQLSSGKTYLPIRGAGSEDSEEDDEVPKAKPSDLETSAEDQRGVKRFAEDQPASPRPVKKKRKNNNDEDLLRLFQEQIKSLEYKQAQVEAKHQEQIKSLEYKQAQVEAKHESELKALKSQVRALQKYQLTGTSPISAAFSLAEFAVDHASSVLRRIVAEDVLEQLAEQGYDEYRREFIRVFGNKMFVEGIDFCRCCCWEYQSLGLTMAEYFQLRGFNPKVAPCRGWSEAPRRTATCSLDLTAYLIRTEEAIAKELGVPYEELSMFLRLYSVAWRVERNMIAHFFSVYDSETRAKNADSGNKRDFPSEKDSRRRLKAAKNTDHRLFLLEDLETRLWVIQEVSEQVDGITWFKAHTGAFRAFVGLLLSKFPQMLAESLDAADAQQAAGFGCVVMQHLEERDPKRSRRRRGCLVVQKAEICYRFRDRRAAEKKKNRDDPGAELLPGAGAPVREPGAEGVEAAEYARWHSAQFDPGELDPGEPRDRRDYLEHEDAALGEPWRGGEEPSWEPSCEKEPSFVREQGEREHLPVEEHHDRHAPLAEPEEGLYPWSPTDECPQWGEGEHGPRQRWSGEFGGELGADQQGDLERQVAEPEWSPWGEDQQADHYQGLADYEQADQHQEYYNHESEPPNGYEDEAYNYQAGEAGAGHGEVEEQGYDGEEDEDDEDGDGDWVWEEKVGDSWEIKEGIWRLLLQAV